jgi:hypothetical protein
MEYKPWFPGDGHTNALEFALDDVPTPRVGLTCCNRLVLFTFMLLPASLTYIMCRFTEDLLLTLLASAAFYLAFITIFQNCCLPFRYEVYLSKDTVNWKKKACAAPFWVFLGLLGPLAWFLAWMYWTTFTLNSYSELAPKISFDWMMYFYMICCTVVGVVFLPGFETIVYNVLIDVCFEESWWVRV